MSLIDFDDTKNKKEENINGEKVVCLECKRELPKTSIILLCEQCFNKTFENLLNKIKDTLININNERKKIDDTLKFINNDKQIPNLHLISRNKLEIDELNFIALRKKLNIDFQLNKDAFMLNQIQANKIRKEMNWILFDTSNIDDVLKNLGIDYEK